MGEGVSIQGIFEESCRLNTTDSDLGVQNPGMREEAGDEEVRE